MISKQKSIALSVIAIAAVVLLFAAGPLVLKESHQALSLEECQEILP